MIIKPNWNIFRAKFKDSETTNFEYFCYLLFCVEFNQSYGIFRYKNQSGIESEPIEFDGKVIGFQSKFYDDKLANKKPDLLKMLDTIHDKYPNLSELKLYTNKDWGQGTKERESKPKQEIDKKAKEYKINIDWRTDEAYFQALDVSVINKDIASHFFSMESIYDVVIEKQNHTQRILNNIHAQIKFNSYTIELDRTNILNKLEDKLLTNQILILSGVGGVGKTAVIKNLFEEIQENTPFYLFKANEFNKSNVNELFGKYSIEKFIDAHEIYEDKIVVIDSSERLLDIDSFEVFKEFLDSFIQHNWKIIFTTRDYYVDVLNQEFSHFLNIVAFNLNIQVLNSETLEELSEKFNFCLPTDFKLEELIKNPFYFNEYLMSYNNDEQIDYQYFKQKIWDKKIKHSSSEQCFLKLAFIRANEGQFFINTDCVSSSLKELVEEGILSYEKTFGHFISHDIYEEWALERIINREFLKRSDEKSFFESIGSSLPIRRAFRSWVSERLLLDDENIKSFIESIIDSKDIELFWKDEIFISILLSNYSDTFFENFDRELKENNFELLKRLSFLLRLACKEVDNSLLERYKINGVQKIEMFRLFNMPKGNGWKSFISFIFENIENLQLQNINMILPALVDWNSKYFDGEITKKASLIALKYYALLNKETHYGNDKYTKDICRIIINGSSEIISELESIFTSILDNNSTNHSAPYNKLPKMILVGLDGYLISKNMPEYVFKLANLFWTKSKPEKNEDGILSFHQREDVEDAYGLEKYRFEYYPSSAYQTPILPLLRNHFKITLDFILEFVNKSVKHYVKSGWKYQEDIQPVNVYIDESTVITQYHSSALWNTYRGTSSPISPNLLQSIHMALEKYLLEIAEFLEAESLELWLIYLLKNSQSSSISAVVASVVLANQDKTFNVAKLLFKTKQFIQTDLMRCYSENQVKDSIAVGYGINYKDKIYQDERLKTCEDKHRDTHLEILFLNYQLFRTKEVSEEESIHRQEILWEILDNYYEKLPLEKEQSDKDKRWGIVLARMDRRKINIETEKVKDGVQMTFHSELSPELKKYSEEGQRESSNTIKYTSLYLWSINKIKNNEDYKKYKEYEENPLLSLEQLKEVTKIPHVDKNFIFQNEIFPNVCIILLRDYNEKLSVEDKELCKEIILEVTGLLFTQDYRFQISDGVESSIKFLPILLKDFSELKNDIKLILLLHLFNDYQIGMGSTHFYDYAISAIENYFGEDDIKSFILGYLLLKPKYDTNIEKIRKETYAQRFESITKEERDKKFLEENKTYIEKFIYNEIPISDISDISDIELYMLNVAFKMLPFQTNNIIYKKLARDIIEAFSLKLFIEYEDEKIKYEVKQIFIDKFAVFILELNKDDIQYYLQPIIDNFKSSEEMARLFTKIIWEQDKLEKYENFWHIWNLLEPNIIATCKDGDYYHNTKQVVQAYLLAFSPYGELWKDNAINWHTLKEKDKRFFKRMSEKIGHCPSTLYSISKFLTSIGLNFLNDGIVWVSNILRTHIDFRDDRDNLETNTIYYLEKISRKYIFENTEKIKKERKRKDDILIILNFLIEKGSSVGYMLRERIL